MRTDREGGRRHSVEERRDPGHSTLLCKLQGVMAKQRASIVPVGKQDPEPGGSSRSDSCSQHSAKLIGRLSGPSQVVPWQRNQLLKRFATLNIASKPFVLIRTHWSRPY